MEKFYLILFSLLLSSTFVYSQTKQKPIEKTTSSPLKKLLAGTGLPYHMVNDSLAAIPYEGENIAEYQVVIQKVGDLYIIYTNLSEALPGKIDESKYKYLLQQNDHFDIVKVGLSDDNIMYVRVDVYRLGVTTPMMKRIIHQVANVTNIIGGELK